ncbi:MAG: Gx transporter family protein [Clostridia bacterium]|nr:Gx transporter family protein [Clostridia bacterium]
MKNKKLKKTVFLSLCITFSLILSYVETLIPPIWSAVPGIKIGLANIAVIFVLYRFGAGCAMTVSFVRLVLASLLFGNPITFIYSLSGAVFSLFVMAVLRKIGIFSMIGVSITGAVSHNLGQILTAMLLLETPSLRYYMAVLIFTGTLSGIFVGLCSAMILKRMEKFGGV